VDSVSPHHKKLKKICNDSEIGGYTRAVLGNGSVRVIQNHENEHVRGIGQSEARHRKYKMLKLGSGQAYYRSND
jgi:hypothetical protein